MSELLNYSDAELLGLAQTIYDIPSLAAWRAAELKALRHCTFAPPVLEIGCGNGRFASLLFERVDWGIDLNPREMELCAERNALYRPPLGAWMHAGSNLPMESSPRSSPTASWSIFRTCRECWRNAGASCGQAAR